MERFEYLYFPHEFETIKLLAAMIMVAVNLFSQGVIAVGMVGGGGA